MRDPIVRPQHAPQAGEDQHVRQVDPVGTQRGQVERVVEHAGVDLGRRPGRRRRQLPVAGRLGRLPLAQAERRQRGRGLAAAELHQGPAQLGAGRREFGQHQGTEISRFGVSREGLGL
jgi:hypothetical protein